MKPPFTFGQALRATRLRFHWYARLGVWIRVWDFEDRFMVQLVTTRDMMQCGIEGRGRKPKAAAMFRVLDDEAIQAIEGDSDLRRLQSVKRSVRVEMSDDGSFLQWWENDGATKIGGNGTANRKRGRPPKRKQ